MFYAIENDLIGGWCVSEFNKPLSEHDTRPIDKGGKGEAPIGDFMTREHAETVAEALNGDLLYRAWGVIANVSGGDWSLQSPEWQEAARRWRDKWHETLGVSFSVSKVRFPETETQTLSVTIWRKKPVEIAMMQYTGDNTQELLQWIESRGGNAFHNGEALVITTLEGEVTASVGDWVAKGVKDEFYPIKPDIHEATYEFVYELGESGKIDE